jgi:glycosyltransferase involved in cell wall biosynthesis
MKIGIYHHTYIYGSGIDNVLREIAVRLSKKNCVEIITFYTDRKDSDLKIRVISRSKSKSVFNAYNPITAIKVIRSVKDYDVVFTSIYPMNSLVSLGRIFYGKKHRHISYFWAAPPASVIRGFFEKIYHLFLNLTEIIMPHVGVDVSLVPNEFIKRWNKVKKAKILPLHGVDLKRFSDKAVSVKSADKIRQKNHIPKNAKIIFTVGRVVPYKGIDLLIDVVKKVNESGLDTYLIVGGSLWNKKYVDELKKIKEGHTLLVGLIPEKDLAPYYKLCDAYVSASKWEGQLNAEACAMSKPYVAFDTTSHRFTIQQAKTGFLVSPYDTEEFADKVISLLKDKALSGRIGKNARIWAENNSDYDRIAENIERVMIR